jgi:hypothetical protein
MASLEADVTCDLHFSYFSQHKIPPPPRKKLKLRSLCKPVRPPFEIRACAWGKADVPLHGFGGRRPPVAERGDYSLTDQGSSPIITLSHFQNICGTVCLRRQQDDQAK